jgi:DNA-binding IclR family transcriptional regulator
MYGKIMMECVGCNMVLNGISERYLLLLNVLWTMGTQHIDTFHNEEPLVQTTARVFNIITVLQSMNGATLDEVAAEMPLSKSSVYNHLMTLKQQGYIVKEDDTYDLGIKFLDHGTYAKERRAITKVSKPVMENLADETGELVWLSVEERGQKRFVNKMEGSQAIPTKSHCGSSSPLHSTASGKSILAFLPKSYVDEILDCYGMPKLTDETITDRDELYNELETIRERGYSFCSSETMPGLRAVAAPIVHEDEVEGAISISGPRSRFQGEYFRKELPELVVDATNEIELKLSQTWFDEDWPNDSSQ